MQALINAVKPTGGNTANAFLIFDWQSNTDFKFAGIDVSTNKLELGHRTAAGWVVDNWVVAQVKSGIDYVVMLSVSGSAATLKLGTTTVSFTYAQRIDSLGVKHGLADGVAGIGAMGGTKAQIDDVIVQAPPRIITVDKTVDFSSASPASGLFNLPAQVKGTWTTSSDGRFVGSTASTTAPAVNLIGTAVTPGSMLDIATTFKTSGQGGLVFDYQGPDYYKFVTLSADTNQLVIGHRAKGVTVIDRNYAMSVSSGTDYKLGVVQRGGLVNVSINGAVVTSFLFNETVTMGGYGFISIKGATSGTTSFDVIRLRTDDAAYAPPATALFANAAPEQLSASVNSSPSAADIAAAVVEAKRRWAASGLDAQVLQSIDQLTVTVANLDGLMLGQSIGNTILIDADAAGYGWFVDATPGDDREFRVGADRVAASAGCADQPARCRS